MSCAVHVTLGFLAQLHTHASGRSHAIVTCENDEEASGDHEEASGDHE